MRSVAETRAGPLAVEKEAKSTSNILSHAREVCAQVVHTTVYICTYACNFTDFTTELNLVAELQHCIEQILTCYNLTTRESLFKAALLPYNYGQ